MVELISFLTILYLLALPNTFQAWFAVTTLHLWLLRARLRAEGEPGKMLFQEAVEHLWTDAEIKLAEAGVSICDGDITGGS
jgi:cytochrome b pre-mRNA-processing protein 3